MRGESIEMFKVMSRRESINWVKPLSIKKKLEISGPTERAIIKDVILFTLRE